MNVEPLARAFADAAEWLRAHDLGATSRRAWTPRDAESIQHAMAEDLPTTILVAELSRRGGGRRVAWVSECGLIEVIDG